MDIQSAHMRLRDYLAHWVSDLAGRPVARGFADSVVKLGGVLVTVSIVVIIVRLVLS